MKKKIRILFAIVLFSLTVNVVISFSTTKQKTPIILKEFIFQKAPFRECHASTIVELKNGDLMASWFGGTAEKNPDVVIWLSRKKNKTWTIARRLPEDIYGAIKNKPLELSNGMILCPSSTEDKGWRVHFERTKDFGASWELIEPINDPKIFEAIQPTLLTYSDGRIQALCRSRQKRIVETWSTDKGKTWSKIKATSLPNPSAGFDGITLKDGRQFLVYNHTTEGRAKLNVAVSQDGKSWKAALVLENQPGQYSYPAVIQTKDAMVHVTYTYDLKKIKHVVIDPSKLELKPIWDF